VRLHINDHPLYQCGATYIDIIQARWSQFLHDNADPIPIAWGKLPLPLKPDLGAIIALRLFLPDAHLMRITMSSVA